MYEHPRGPRGLLLATFCVWSACATGPVINQITPNQGGIAGGTRITIFGAGFSVGPMVRALPRMGASRVPTTVRTPVWCGVVVAPPRARPLRLRACRAPAPMPSSTSGRRCACAPTGHRKLVMPRRHMIGHVPPRKLTTSHRLPLPPSPFPPAHTTLGVRDRLVLLHRQPAGVLHAPFGARSLPAAERRGDRRPASRRRADVVGRDDKRPRGVQRWRPLHVHVRDVRDAVRHGRQRRRQRRRCVALRGLQRRARRGLRH